MGVTPELHAALLGGAVVSALVFSGIILARNPKSTPARLHAIYGGSVAWWLFAMAMVAVSRNDGTVEVWTRLAHLGIGMLPGVIYHLNTATAGVAHRHQRGIRAHYALSGAVTLFCVAWPDLLAAPRSYGWGPYPAYTAWGILPAGFLLVTFVEVVRIHRRAVRDAAPGTAYREKVRAFHRGNLVAMLALVDFLPVFGVGIYPFGFAVITVLHALTVFGSIRYRLIEITPEFAAEQILATLPDGVFAVDSQGLIRFANGAAARTLGREVDELIDRPVETVVESEELREILRLPAETERPVREIRLGPGPDDRSFVRVSGALLRDQRRAPVARVWLLHDLTQQRLAEAESQRLEGWVRHGQKLETLGVLAGGIAHDFNNLLMAILGSADVARLRLSDRSTVEDALRSIVAAAERASNLTGQLLSYAGEGPTHEVPVDLNDLCRAMGELVKTAISKKAELTTSFADSLPMVLADEGQMSQIILNLVTNASDALGGGSGTIELRTGVMPSSALVEDVAGAAGEYVYFEVSDTGIGMDPATRERMFDPFFTTKFTGRGLGLATVLGIVRAHGGHIRVDTKPGHGTRFTVALPGAPISRVERSGPGRISPSWRGSGVALVADDEPQVRRVVGAMLANAGFEVVEAADGKQAVSIFQARQFEVSLVLLDVAMPGMDGREALHEIRALSPGQPIIMMSGYSDLEASTATESGPPPFLRKPFRAAALHQALREVMAGTGS